MAENIYKENEVLPNDFRFIWTPQESSNKNSATFNDMKELEKRLRLSKEADVILNLGVAGIHSWSPTFANLDERRYK